MKEPYLYIDDYMADALNDADRKAFEAAMVKDAELKGMVDHYQIIKASSGDLLDLDMRSVLETIQQGSNSRRKENFKWGLLLILLLSIAGLSYYLTREAKVSPQEYIAQNYSRAIVDIERSGEVKEWSTQTKADHAYASKDLKVSATLYQLALQDAKSASDSSRIYLMLGRVALEQGLYDEATNYLALSQEKEARVIRKMLENRPD